MLYTKRHSATLFSWMKILEKEISLRLTFENKGAQEKVVTQSFTPHM